MSLTMLEGSTQLDRAKLAKDLTFEEWMRLTDDEKRYVYKSVWNPRRPEIGAATREEILKKFRESLPVPDEDIIMLRYDYFGACVGAIHIVLKTRLIKFRPTLPGSR